MRECAHSPLFITRGTRVAGDTGDVHFSRWFWLAHAYADVVYSIAACHAHFARTPNVKHSSVIRFWSSGGLRIGTAVCPNDSTLSSSHSDPFCWTKPAVFTDNWQSDGVYNRLCMIAAVGHCSRALTRADWTRRQFCAIVPARQDGLEVPRAVQCPGSACRWAWCHRPTTRVTSRWVGRSGCSSHFQQLPHRAQSVVLV